MATLSHLRISSKIYVHINRNCALNPYFTLVVGKKQFILSLLH